MSPTNRPPLPTAVPPPEVLWGLDAADADRPAHEVLSAIAREGLTMDPDTLKARDFLSLL